MRSALQKTVLAATEPREIRELYDQINRLDRDFEEYLEKHAPQERSDQPRDNQFAPEPTAHQRAHNRQSYNELTEQAHVHNKAQQVDYSGPRMNHAATEDDFADAAIAALNEPSAIQRGHDRQQYNELTFQLAKHRIESLRAALVAAHQSADSVPAQLRISEMITELEIEIDHFADQLESGDNFAVAKKPFHEGIHYDRITKKPISNNERLTDGSIGEPGDDHAAKRDDHSKQERLGGRLSDNHQAAGGASSSAEQSNKNEGLNNKLSGMLAAFRNRTRQLADKDAIQLTSAELEAPPNHRDPKILMKLARMLKKGQKRNSQPLNSGPGPKPPGM